jgi:hypothetical protein
MSITAMYSEQNKTQGHRPIVYVLIAFVAFRLMVLLLMKPGGYIGTLSDFDIYRLMASYASQDFYPSVDYWMEYPPLFPWVLVAIYRLSLLLPIWRAPGFWFNTLLSTVLLLAETANLILIYLIGKRLYGERIAVRVAWVYSLLFIPLLMMLGRFDVLGLTFLLLALYLTLIRRPLASGAIAGLGFLVKLWSVIVIPVAFWREPTWRRRVLLIAVTLMTIIAVAMPFVLLNPELFASSWTVHLKRSSWETVWALLEGYTGWGSAGGANRFDPADAGASQHPSTLPWLVISAGFALLYLWFWTRPTDWNDDRRAVAFTGLTMNMVILYLKGYSPQYLVWLLPFVILLLPGLRGITYALLLSIVNIVEYPLYFSMLRNQPWVLACTVLARTGLLVLLAVEYGRMALSQPIPAHWSRRLCLGAVAVLAIVGVAAAPFAYEAYYQNRLAINPHRAAVEVLKSEALRGARVVVGGDEASGAQGVFDETYAFLQRQFDVTSVQTDWWYPDWEPRMARAIHGHDQAWLYAPVDSPLHAWLDEHYTPIATYDLEGWRLSGWDTR